MSSETDLIQSAALGRLWMVKKCIKSGISSNKAKEEALYKSVIHGRTSVVKYLLEHGSNANAPKRNLLPIAARKGFSHIVTTLVQHGADIHINNDEPLMEAIQHGHTNCVRILLENGANLHIDEDLPLLEACRKRHFPIMRNLLEFGADVDTSNGRCILEAIEGGHHDVVNELIKYGADVSICDDAPIRKAAEKKQIGVIIELINNGANRDALRSCNNIDDTTMTILKSYTRRKGIIKRLLNAIHDSFEEHDFKWQVLCSRKNPDIHLLRKHANLLGIKDTTSKNKHCICAELAVKYEEEVSNRPQIDPSVTDFSGTPINELPFWKIFHVEGTPFNIFDLLKMIRGNNHTNPFTRNPLPVDDIKKRETLLRELLTRARYSDKNLLENVRDTPVPTETMTLRSQLESEVWDALIYVPNMDIIMNADDDRIDDMVDKLHNICKRKSIFEILSNVNIDIYPMLSETAMATIKSADGLFKKKKFSRLLSDIVNVNDEHSETRKMAVTIMLKYFANQDMTNNTNGTNGTNDTNGQDDVTFMFGDNDTMEILDTVELLHLLLWNNEDGTFD